MVKHIRSSFSFAFEQYKSWLLSPRILVIIYIIVFLNDNITKEMMFLCNETEYSINIAEPLALIFSKSIYTVAVPIVYISLMTDFPHINGNVIYIHRMTRMSWTCGEIIFSVISSLTYVISLILGTIIYCMERCSFNNEWSEYTLKMFIEHSELYQKNTNLFIASSVYTQGKPVDVICHSVTLIFLYIFLLSLIIMLFKLINIGEIGVLVSVAITFFGLASDSGASPMMWAFPITHTVFGWHYDIFFRQTFFSVGGSYIYLLTLISVFLILNFNLSKKVRLS